MSIDRRVTIVLSVPTQLITYPCHHCGFVVSARTAESLSDSVVAHLHHCHPKGESA